LVTALAEYRRELEEHRFLDRLDNVPAGLSEDRRDAREKALEVFRASAKEPKRAVELLASTVAVVPGFALSIVFWLAQDLPRVAEDSWLTGTTQHAARDSEPIEAEEDVLAALKQRGADSARRRVSIRQIETTVDPSRKPGFCKKPVAALVKKGKLKSRKGPGGGVWLAE
jgi:hypothetical protein